MTLFCLDCNIEISDSIVLILWLIAYPITHINLTICLSHGLLHDAQSNCNINFFNDCEQA